MEDRREMLTTSFQNNLMIAGYDFPSHTGVGQILILRCRLVRCVVLLGGGENWVTGVR